VSILELFCSVDDFWVRFEPWWQREILASGRRQRRRPGELHPSELMTILILFQTSHYRTFKAYYTEYVQVHLRAEFPQLVSYSRFVELMPSVLLPLVAYLHTQMGRCTGISFIDSTPRAARPRSAGSTASSSTSSSTSAASCSPSASRAATSTTASPSLRCLSASKGPLASSLGTRATFHSRSPSGSWSTRASSSSPACARTCATACCRSRTSSCCASARSSRRSTITSRTSARPSHTRHRSPINFLVNLVCGLIAYCHSPKKPSLNLDPNPDLLALPAA